MNDVLVWVRLRISREVCYLTLFLFCLVFTPFMAIQAETVIVHATVVWEMTDIVVQENMSLHWKVEKDDLWCFNQQLLPKGHNADGIPVEALKGYVYPGQPIGKLVGRIGDSGRMFPMGTSGTLQILPGEDGEFLYLSMNDDIMGLYGKGFKDNIGELIVKVHQTREK